MEIRKIGMKLRRKIGTQKGKLRRNEKGGKMMDGMRKGEVQLEEGKKVGRKG